MMYAVVSTPCDGDVTTVYDLDVYVERLTIFAIILPSPLMTKLQQLDLVLAVVCCTLRSDLFL